jgi:hypothetical protein
VGGFVDVEGLSGGEMVDAGDVAVVDESAEAGFEEIEMLETLASHVSRECGFGSAQAQLEGGVHRFVSEEMGWQERVHGVFRG